MKEYTVEQILKCVDGSGGIVNTIAKRLAMPKNGGDGKCSWATAKKLIDKYPEVIAAVSDEREINLDKAERRILDDTDVATAKWYLMVKGRDRGYSNDVIIKSETDFSNLPDDLKNWTVEDFARATFLKASDPGSNGVSGNGIADLEDMVFGQDEGGGE